MAAEPSAADSEARDLARELVGSLHGLRPVDLDTAGAPLGLDIPTQLPDPSPVGEDVTSLSKSQRLDRAFDAIATSDYETVCARFLQQGDLSVGLRNRVEDLLWSREKWPVITARVRRELAEALDASGAIWLEADGLLDLVRQHWVLHPPAWSFDGTDPYEPVARHMIWNPGDWTTVDFFKEIGALGGGDRRFALFLEALLSGSVNPDEVRQRELVGATAPVLARAGLQIVESGATGGYPDFTVVSSGTRPRPAQLVLFGSSHSKPALRVRDVLEQSLEVLGEDDAILAYDVPVSERGLTWLEVESWWSSRPRSVQISLASSTVVIPGCPNRPRLTKQLSSYIAVSLEPEASYTGNAPVARITLTANGLAGKAQVKVDRSRTLIVTSDDNTDILGTSNNLFVRVKPVAP